MILAQNGPSASKQDETRANEEERLVSQLSSHCFVVLLIPRSL